MQHALDHLLDHARDALMAGDFPELLRLAPELEGEAARMTRTDGVTVARLLQKAERNAILLKAAGRGVKAALGRLEEISAGPSLTTYDASGRKAAISTLGSGTVHRA
jgi:hypothetical protein